MDKKKVYNSDKIGKKRKIKILKRVVKVSRKDPISDDTDIDGKWDSFFDELEKLDSSVTADFLTVREEL